VNERENFFRAVEFRYPEWIPCSVALMPATWKKYGRALEDIVERYPELFRYQKTSAEEHATFGPGYCEGEYFTDNWGCVWYNVQGGLEGQVVDHPLEDWNGLATWQPPDPLVEDDRGLQDWDEACARLQEAKAEGWIAIGGLPHGFLFMRLFYLRGFENLMIDLVTDPPELRELIQILLDHNMALVKKWIELGVEVLSAGEDLGGQDRLLMTPKYFRKYIRPCYKELFGTTREAGCHVYLHSDGHILEIIDDLIECGVTILNPQIRANTLDGLVEACKGRICINLDLDRQFFPFATPAELREHIEEAVVKLGSAEGGLMLHAECEPDVPLENIEAICETLTAFRTYY